MKVKPINYATIGKRAESVDFMELMDLSMHDNRPAIKKALVEQQRTGDHGYDYTPGPYYEKKKKMQSYIAPKPKVDLFVTGQLHKFYYLHTEKDRYVFRSSLVRYGYMLDLYGENMFALTVPYADIVRTRNTQFFKKRYFAHLFGK